MPVYRLAYLECMLMIPTLLMLILICIWFSLVYLTTLKSEENGLRLTDLPQLNATNTEFTRTLHVPIEQVSSVKSLGAYVNENSRWYSHIDKLGKKFAFAIGAINWVKQFVPQSTCSAYKLTSWGGWIGFWIADLALKSPRIVDFCVRICGFWKQWFVDPL